MPDDQIESPDLWRRVVARFTVGYGDPPDFSDPEDQHAFLSLVREEMEAEWTRKLVEAFARTEARIRAATAALDAGDGGA